MLIKEDIKKMLKQEQYRKILFLFKKECKKMMFNYVKEKNLLDIDESTDISDLLLLISEEDSKLNGCIGIITTILYDENKSVFEKLNYILDNYDYIKIKLT